MGDYKERLIKEKNDLDDKRNKLDKYMSGEHFHVDCDEAERERMIRQYNLMCEYSEILTARLKPSW